MALNLAGVRCHHRGAASSAGVLLQIGFMRRFDPEFVAAARRIEAGEIGQPMMIKSLTHGPGLPPPWARDLQHLQRHAGRGQQPRLGHRALADGLELRARLRRGGQLQRARPRGVDTPNFYDNVLVNIRFESGGLGSISGICPCGYGYDARVEIVGEKGIMQIGELQGQAVVVCTDRDQGLVTPIYRTWPERFAWGYIHEMEHFVHCIRSGAHAQGRRRGGRWAVAGVLAGTRSFLEERPVLSERGPSGSARNEQP